MLTVAHPDARRRRHHRRVQLTDRQTLERAGWRTLLEYRENHVRDHDGTLLAVVPQWTGEVELDRAATADCRRAAGLVATATAATPEAVWAELVRMTVGAERRISS